MNKKVLGNLLLAFLLSAVVMMTGCGGGAGSSSPSASLSIAIDKTSVASGSPVVATVTLAALSGSPVNGVKVRVVSSDPSVVATAEGYTNTSGVVSIPLPTQWISSDRTVTLVANSDGITPSTSLALAVTAPKLTCSIPATATSTWTNNFAFTGTLVTGGYQIKFVDGIGNPITGQAVSLYIDSFTNTGNNPLITYTPVQGTTITAPPGVYTSTTDSSGIIQIPMTIQMDMNRPDPCSTDPTSGVFSCTGTALSVTTANWRAVAVYSGQTFTTTGSSLITFTNTGS